MTIAQAFNDIATAQGGTPSSSGTIAGAIDALNDALAGSDQECAQTIEGAVRLLGAHIGGGVAPSGTIEITENGEGIDVAQYAYADVNVSGGGSSDFTTATVTVSMTGSKVFALLMPCIEDGDEATGCTFIAYADQGVSKDFVVPLYKGTAFAWAVELTGDDYNVLNFVEPSTTGNVTSDEGSLTITGNCTVAFSE